MTQIMTHRPFIPTIKRPATIGFPSLAICTNSARSLIHVVVTAKKRPSFLAIEEKVIGPLQLAGIILMVSLYHPPAQESSSSEAVR